MNLLWKIMKERYFHSCLMKYAQSSKPILGPHGILYIDVSSETTVMALSQVQDGKKHVISYGGKKLSSAEKKFSTTAKNV